MELMKELSERSERVFEAEPKMPDMKPVID